MTHRENPSKHFHALKAARIIPDHISVLGMKRWNYHPSSYLALRVIQLTWNHKKCFSGSAHWQNAGCLRLSQTCCQLPTLTVCFKDYTVYIKKYSLGPCVSCDPAKSNVATILRSPHRAIPTTWATINNHSVELMYAAIEVAISKLWCW